MHAFLFETKQSPQKLDLKSLVTEAFETTLFYEIQTIQEVREFKKSWLFSQPTKTLCVISNVDNAKEEAQNALLKLLEEPPHANLMFLLIVENVSRILPTIQSRLTLVGKKLKQESTKTQLDLSFATITKITDRDEAISLLRNVSTESALKTVAALEKNGNVTLQLTNFLLSQN